MRLLSEGTKKRAQGVWLIAGSRRPLLKLESVSPSSSSPHLLNGLSQKRVPK